MRSYAALSQDVGAVGCGGEGKAKAKGESADILLLECHQISARPALLPR
jgi:hypothetical protein